MSESGTADATYIPGSKMTRVAVTQYYDVPDSDIAVLLEMAGFGIAYWAGSMTVNEVERTVSVYELEEDHFNTVSFTDLAETLIAIGTGEYDSGYASYARHYLAELTTDPDGAAGHIDSDLADHVVQYAIWQELVYG